MLAVVSKRKRAYAEARTVKVLEPSPDRIAPVADHPGAPWQVLPYERQLEVKQAQVDDALRRIGKLDGYELEPIVPAVEQWRYRNKLEYSFGTDAAGELVCGFHAPGRWDEIVPVSDCLLASERGNAAREQIVAWCREQSLTAYDRRSGERGAAQSRRARGAANVRDPGPARHQRRSAARPRVARAGGRGLRRAAVDADREPRRDDGRAARPSCWPAPSGSRRSSGSMRFSISSEAFFQTNTEMAERLYELAIEYARPTGFERVFDLYCGIGTIALSIAPRVGEVWGLELVEQAIADAIANARANEVANARFFAGDVRLALRELVTQAGRPDVVVVDPPRAGLSQKVVRRIIEAAPQRMVYVSCNPTTLAPNAAQLVEAGYRLVRVRPVDMFPQTPHIECVAELTRADDR